MIGTKIVLNRGGRDEAEKPFWISFADLMTALMVLFLVVMGVALIAVTKNVTEREKKKKDTVWTSNLFLIALWRRRSNMTESRSTGSAE